jgi:hypothetical protein
MPAATRRPPRDRAHRRARTLGLGFGLGLALLAAAGRADAQAFDLAALMQLLGGVRAGEATFVERREVRNLDRPLVSKGRLSFRAPDTLVRETLEPRRERVAISGDTLEMSAGGRRRSMPVDAVPEAGLIVEAIRGTLTGNRESLEQLFEARVSGTPEQWWLDLVPREARLRDAVQSVRLGGQRAFVREVDVYLADGDRSYMTIEPTPSHADAPRARP